MFFKEAPAAHTDMLDVPMFTERVVDTLLLESLFTSALIKTYEDVANLTTVYNLLKFPTCSLLMTSNLL